MGTEEQHGPPRPLELSGNHSEALLNATQWALYSLCFSSLPQPCEAGTVISMLQRVMG